MLHTFFTHNSLPFSPDSRLLTQPTTQRPADRRRERQGGSRHGGDAREGALLREARRLGQVVAGGLVEQDELRAQVTDAVGSPGLLVAVDVGIQPFAAEIFDAL